MICIYCLQDKEKEHFKKAEHVIPQSFGTFEENFTLKDTVCDECNQYFGDNLEIFLARDTFEGIQRHKYNVQDPAKFKSMGKRSELIIRVEEGQMKGAYAYLYFSKFYNRVIIKPLKQVGFRKSGFLEYDFFQINELKKVNISNYDLKEQESIILFGVSPAEAKELLKNVGVDNFNCYGEKGFNSNQPDILCKIEGTINVKILRVVCKIAFNYLAYWEGKDFVLDKSFDGIRNFILNGIKPKSEFISIEDETLLIEEIEKGMNIVGHFITTEWLDDKTIFARVSLFNIFFYHIFLTDCYYGEFRDVTRGHLFNPNARLIHRIGRM